MLTTVGCQSEKPKETAETPKETVTVKFSYPPYGYDEEKEKAFWEANIAEFEAANPGIKIEQTWESWDNVYTKWDQMVASGDTADIAYDFPLTAVHYATQGELLPLTDVVNNLGGESAFSPGMRYFKSGDDWYGVPHGDASMVLLYRKDLLKEAGYDAPPKNWDEMIEIAKACTKKGQYGLGFFTGDTYQSCQILTAFMKQAGGVMLDDQGKVALDSPENLKALQLVDQLVNKDKVVPSAAVSWEHADPANAVGTGKCAMAITWGGFGTQLEGMFPEEYENIGFVQQPVGPGGTSGSWSGTGGFFMFKNAKHPDEAKKFIEYMSQPSKSKEWALVSGNVSPFVAIADDPELLKLEWYKAMRDQSATQLHLGWDYGITPGCFMSDPDFTKAMVSVVSKGTAAGGCSQDAAGRRHQDARHRPEQLEKK